ncbi:hypothetical protein T08_7979, partial [Trichinella sp. T8]
DIKRTGFASVSDVPTKIASSYNIFGKITTNTLSPNVRLVPWQTNPNLLNKRHLKFACAYLNTQASSPSGTPLKRQQDGCILI